MLAAHALTRRYRRVLVLERDADPFRTELRYGVPQREQCHVFLTGGQRSIENLFPGILEEARVAGAVPIDFGADVHWNLRGSILPRPRTSVRGCYASRPFWESLIRARVEKQPGIETRYGTKVVGYRAGKFDRTVGVVVDDNRLETLHADLVVDALGARSSAHRWLTEIGMCTAPIAESAFYIGYCSQVFRPLWSDRSWKVFLHFPFNSSRGAAILPIEGGKVLLTLIGYQGDYPGSTDSEFRRFAGTLGCPEVEELIQTGVPETAIAPFRIPSARWNRYDIDRSLPVNWLSVGDAWCRLNPTFGQGMTCAALQANLLYRLCGTSRFVSSADFARTFFRDAAGMLCQAWETATREENAAKRTNVYESIVSRYYDLVLAVAANDEGVFADLLKVNHFLAGRRRLFMPRTMFKVLSALLHKWLLNHSKPSA